MSNPHFRGTQILDGYDVVVAGGGPAGCCAAVAAARGGAKTLLVEATGCLGGMASSGLVPAWCGFHDGEKLIHRGLAAEILAGLRAEAEQPPPTDIRDLGAIDAEAMKRVLDRIVTAAGVDVLFFTILAGVEMARPDQVAAALVANKSGIFAVPAKLFVDGTGDADLCHFAGARTQKGDDSGDLQPVSLCMVMGGLGDHPVAGAPADWRERIVADPQFPRIKDDFFYPAFRINGGHQWGVDGTDVRGVTRAMMEGRMLAREFRDAFRKHLPAGGNAELIQTASLLGVRETRRIVGEYSLSADDYLARRRFPDEISLNCFFIDIHPSWASRRRETRGEWNWQREQQAIAYAAGEFHGIPYRCLLPQGLANVIDAGRSVSSDRAVQSAIRVMPPCMTMGQAAGTAAALLLQAGQDDFRAVTPLRLRTALSAAGAFLPELPA